ncbi:MAG: Asp-tRNA(Asn)/Glu-tRNA(Gln) amidotransferase subunit GatC [Simkania negevensis]|nr:Asp-tRNA(Asn)/Glu-tRNA(Gln) amidotransferase subunit GatC [Simkania negevensis]
MKSFDLEVVKKLTRLSRIECSEKEIEVLAQNLEAIVHHFDSLNELNTEGIPPCNHALETLISEMREDEVKETLDRKTFLENSPSHVGGMLRIPPVIQF